MRQDKNHESNNIIYFELTLLKLLLLILLYSRLCFKYIKKLNRYFLGLVLNYLHFFLCFILLFLFVCFVFVFVLFLSCFVRFGAMHRTLCSGRLLKSFFGDCCVFSIWGFAFFCFVGSLFHGDLFHISVFSIQGKKGALNSQPQVIKFTSCLSMVGGSLRVLRLPPPLKYGHHGIAEILLKVAVKHQKSINPFRGKTTCLRN